MKRQRRKKSGDWRERQVRNEIQKSDTAINFSGLYLVQLNWCHIGTLGKTKPSKQKIYFRVNLQVKIFLGRFLG